MTSKVIKLTDNNNNALLPISDAQAIQMTYANVTKSVHDAILDTEEAIATTYNNLTSRIDGIEYDLNNTAVLNTNNSASQTPMSNERIEGNIYLHKVAKTGSWNDLNDTPDIPADPVKSNWNETNSSSLAYILNKPTNVSAFTNDAGYLTQHQSLANYYTKTETNNNFSRKTAFDSSDEIEADGPTANLDFAYDNSNGTIYWSDANNSGAWKRLLDTDDLKEATVVNVTQNGSTYTMDKSCSQVLNLVNSNYTVVLKYTDSYFHFAGRDQDELHFVNIDVGHGYIYELFVDGNSTGNTTYYHVISNIHNKQNTLVSGTNIKTVNNESLLGSGNIDADDVEIGYLKTTSTTIQEGQGLPLTITSTDFYKVNSISHPSGGAVYEYSETAETGEYGKIYVDVSTNKIYHYKKSGISSNNNDYVELSPSPANYPKGYWIGTCVVASATVAKVVLSTPYAYVTGNVLAVRFLYGNTVANPTLRIGNRTLGSSITGGTAYPIYYEGHALTDTTLIGANSTVTFVFDGSYYHIISIETNINNLISNAKTTKFGYLNSSGDFYEAYWSTLTDTTTSYYLPAVNQNTLSYTNNLYIDINTGKNYRYKNGTLGTGETRFEEIKPCIAKEKIVRTDRRSFRASSGTAINMESKYFYIFGAPDDELISHSITRLEIASLVNSYDDSKYENDFHGMVYCDDTTFSLPSGIKIANDGILPAMEYNYIFEFHILNGILTFTYTKDADWG